MVRVLLLQEPHSLVLHARACQKCPTRSPQCRFPSRVSEIASIVGRSRPDHLEEALCNHPQRSMYPLRHSRTQTRGESPKSAPLGPFLRSELIRSEPLPRLEDPYRTLVPIQ